MPKQSATADSATKIKRTSMSHKITCKTSQSFEAFNMQVMSMTCRKTSDAVKAIIIMLSCIVNGLVQVPKISRPDLEHGHVSSLEKNI